MKNRFISAIVGMLVGQAMAQKEMKERPRLSDAPMPPKPAAPIFKAPTMPFRLSDEAAGKLAAAEAKRQRKMAARARSGGLDPIKDPGRP